MKKLVFIVGLSALTAFAQEPEKKTLKDEMAEKPVLHFTAKQHFQDLEKELITLNGNAHLTFGTTNLSAGKVILEKSKSQVKAYDNVLLDIPSEQTYIKAHELTYNYQTRLGEMVNAEIKSGYSRIRGKIVFKIGDKKYRIERAEYSTCDVKEDEPCPWRIWSRKTYVTMGEYATAEHPVFMVGGIPILYSPFAFFPVKSERQSGFLIPEFGGTEKTGFRLKNSLFLSLGRSQDMTPTLEYMSKRGVKEGLEYRYVLSELSSGKFQGYYTQDREFYQDFLYRKRYAAAYDHDLYFTRHIFNKATVRLVSDDDYVKDFQNDIQGRSDAGLETKLLQGFVGDHVTLNAEGVYYQSLVSDHPRASNKEITHKLPELRLDFLEIPPFGEDIPFYIGSNISYVNFYNEGGSFKDNNNNSRYDEGTDQLLRSHRIDFFPKLSLPLKFGRYLEWVPAVGLRQTHWWLPAGDENKNRFMMDLGNQVNTNISRIFDLKGKSLLKMKHLIEPRISHRYSPLIKLDEHIPIFDGTDQIATLNSMAWGLQHRFVFKTIDEKSIINYFDGLRFDTSQDFDILELRKQTGIKRPLSDIRNILSMGLFGFSVSTEADYGVYGEEVTRVSHGMQYSDPWTNLYKLNYTYNKRDESNSVNGGIGFNMIDILKFNFGMNYSFDRDVFLERIYQMSYFPRTKCWVLNMNFEDKLDTGLSFNAGVSLLFGENPLSLARVYQEGERQNLRLLAQ